MSLKVRVSRPISSCALGSGISRSNWPCAMRRAASESASIGRTAGERDAVGEVAEQQDDAEVDHEDAHHHREHGREGHLEGHLDGDVPVEDAERTRRADDVQAGRSTYSSTSSGPLGEHAGRGTRAPAGRPRRSRRSRRPASRRWRISAPATGRWCASSAGIARGLEDADQRARAVGIDGERRRRPARASPVGGQQSQHRAVDVRRAAARSPRAKRTVSPATAHACHRRPAGEGVELLRAALRSREALADLRRGRACQRGRDARRLPLDRLARSSCPATSQPSRPSPAWVERGRILLADLLAQVVVGRLDRDPAHHQGRREGRNEDEKNQLRGEAVERLLAIGGDAFRGIGA